MEIISVEVSVVQLQLSNLPMRLDATCLMANSNGVEIETEVPSKGRVSSQRIELTARWEQLDKMLDDLLPRLRENELAAWDEFFRAAWPLVFRTVFRLSNAFTREDAEEIAQDTLAAVHGSLHSFRNESKFRVWMLGISWRKAQGKIAHQNALMRRGKHVALDHKIVDEASLRPSDVVERREDSDRIREALGRLHDRCREVIELRFFAELQYDELASLFGDNVKTIGSRLSRCLTTLGKLFYAARR